MKYGQIAGSKSINAAIYRCFECITEEDARKFIKKFHDQPHDDPQIMHTFRELILGAYLSSNGFKVRYDSEIDEETPDWCICDEVLVLKGIVELTNFHIDRATEKDIEQQARARGMWAGRLGTNDDRLYNSIWSKAQKYKTLVEKRQVPYVIAVFGEFTAVVDMDELQRCLLRQEVGLFWQYPVITGVLFFEENGGQYLFSYIPNPMPRNAMNIPSGTF